MSVDGQVREFMLGWSMGSGDRSDHPLPRRAENDYDRGYAAGRAAYLAAERMERERMEQCPECQEVFTVGPITVRPRNWHLYHDTEQECPSCHGTGRRA